MARELNTRRMYENCIKKHFAHLDNVRIGEITHSHFQEAINRQLEHPRTCQIIYITFNQVCRSAERDRLISPQSLKTICADISLPKYKSSPKRPLTALEKDIIFSADLDTRKSAFLFLLYFCGLRKGEALALTPSDFDWKRKELTINKVIVFDKEKSVDKEYPKSDNGVRVVPMPDALIQKIEPFVRFSSGKIFKNTSGAPLTKTGYDKMWKSIINSLNVAAGWDGKSDKPIQGLTAHIFRHNYCTELCYKVPEISTKMIAKLLGDDESMVLKVYSHIQEEKERPAEVIQSIFKSM